MKRNDFGLSCAGTILTSVPGNFAHVIEVFDNDQWKILFDISAAYSSTDLTSRFNQVAGEITLGGGDGTISGGGGTLTAGTGTIAPVTGTINEIHGGGTISSLQGGRLLVFEGTRNTFFESTYVLDMMFTGAPTASDLRGDYTKIGADSNISDFKPRWDTIVSPWGLHINFARPIVCPPERTLYVVLGPPYFSGDGSTAPTGGYGWLCANGTKTRTLPKNFWLEGGL